MLNNLSYLTSGALVSLCDTSKKIDKYNMFNAKLGNFVYGKR